MKALRKYQYCVYAALLCSFYWLLKSQKSTVLAASNDNNVTAFLKMLRKCEGTSGANGYSLLFGNGVFVGFSGHPNKKVPFFNKAKNKQDFSTAAGAYQFLYSSWLEKKTKLLLPDFSPASQDLAAIDVLRSKGALSLIKAGNIPAAIEKVKKIWASLPGAGYSQPEKSLSNCIAYYKAEGGQISV